MTEPTTAYLATSGSYSDYAVKRVFLDKALAEKYLADGLCDEIEEFEITTTKTKAIAVLRIDWQSASTFNDRPVGESEWSTVRREEDAGQPACRHTVHRQPARNGFGERVTVMVEGHDHDRVRKVLSEQVAQSKAELSEPGTAAT